MAFKNVCVCEVCAVESDDPAGWDYANLSPVVPAAPPEQVPGLAPVGPTAPDPPTMVCPKPECLVAWATERRKPPEAAPAPA